MPGLVPAIYVFLRLRKDVDARDICAKTCFALQPGHDEKRVKSGRLKDRAYSAVQPPSIE